MIQVNNRMKQLIPSRTASAITEAEIKVSEGFANLHAQLQLVEEKLRASVVTAVHSSYYKLAQMATDLDNDLKALTGLLDLAKTIVNGGCGQKKINVQMVVEKLKNALDLPCCLVGKQATEASVRVNFSEILDNLEEHITISNGATVEYSLVSKDNLPDGFEELQTLDDIAGSSALANVSGRDNASVTSVANSSDSDVGSADAKVSSTSSTDVKKWLQDVRIQKPKRSYQTPSSAPAVNYENVLVVHVNSPDSFYVQLLRSKLELQEMCDKLCVHVKNLPAFVHEPALNEIYAVKYEIRANKYQWCRGRVTEIIEREPAGENLYEIFYLDYGNTQKVKKALLRQLTPELMAIPPFAVHCCLYNITPKNQVWSKQATQLMVQIIDNERPIMYVQDRLPSIWHVDLMVVLAAGDSTSIRDALLFTGHGALQDSCADIEVPVQRISSEKIQLIKNDKKYKESETLDVIISYIKDPDHIYVQKAINRKSITEMEGSLEKFYSNKKNKCRVFNPKKGMAVVIHQAGVVDHPWCRAEITNVVKGEGLVEVYLVDYGHHVSVSWANLRKIQMQFITVECQAILVRLADVEPLNKEEGWDSNASGYLNTCIQQKQNFKIVVSEHSDRPHVALFECLPDIDICINGVLVASGYALSTGKISQTVKWHKQQKEKKPDGFTRNLLKTIQSSTAADQTEEERFEDVDEYGSLIKKEVIVLKADNPNAIYIQLKDDFARNQFAELERKLQAFYSTNEKCQLKTIEPGARGVVYKTSAKHYARATILEVKETRGVVLLCDTGEVMEVESSDIYSLDDQFRVYPNFTFKCHLDGIIPAGDSKKWSLLAVEYLQEIFKNQTNVLMTKSSATDHEKNSWPVVMWYVELINNGPLEPTQRKLHCINKELTTNGLALKKRAMQRRKPEVKAVEICQVSVDFTPAPPITKRRFCGIVTYVDDEGVIHLQENVMQEPFEAMVKQMNAYFNNTQPEVNPLQAGDLCTLRYSNNEYWYRGKVIKREDDGTYKVHVIDYGNVETCEHKNLRKTVMYLDLPSFSHKVKLHNVFSRQDKWLASDIDLLRELFAEQKIVVLLMKEATDRRPALVEMYMEDGICANDLVVKHSSNLTKRPFKKRSIADSDDDVIIDDIIEEIICPPEVQQKTTYKFTELPPIGTKLDIGIVNVLDYNRLIFEMNSNIENEHFLTMSQSLQEGGDDQPVLTVIKVGEPCIAKFVEDQQWYRAQIVEILTAEVVKVWYVDFGNFEDVKITELREINQDWLQYPLQQFTAEIYGIKLRDDGKMEKAVNFLIDFCGTVQTAKIVELSPLKIELFKPDSPDEELLYWDLILDGVLTL